MTKIESAVRERLHLLRLKSKYAGKILYSATNKKLYLLSSSDGQKIAIRLSRRITVVTRQLKKVLNEYNSKSSTTNRMSWEDATTLSVYIHTPLEPQLSLTVSNKMQCAVTMKNKEPGKKWDDCSQK